MPNVVAIIVQDEGGKLLVHRRSRSKRVFPGLLGLGAGGKQEPGETLEEAARRELAEETGIEAIPEELFELRYDSEAVSHCIGVFRIRFSGDLPVWNPEFEEIFWLEQDEFQSCCDAGDVCPDTVKFFEEAKRRGIL